MLEPVEALMPEPVEVLMPSLSRHEGRGGVSRNRVGVS